MLIDHELYEQTLKILRGEEKLAPVYCALKDWLKSRFEMTACNFAFHETELFNDERRFRLNIVLFSKMDYIRMLQHGRFYDHEKGAEISRKFDELAQEFDLKDKEKARDAGLNFYDFSLEINVNIRIYTFSAVVNSLKEKYQEHAVWDIIPTTRGIVIFYDKESDKNGNSKNGVSEMIRNDYLAALREHDEFGTIRYDEIGIGFESKELLDNSFEGRVSCYLQDQGL